MVCQEAAQTRFQALKNESGSSGRHTVIVRVVTCFQPLHDCQVSQRQGSFHGVFSSVLMLKLRILMLC